MKLLEENIGKMLLNIDLGYKIPKVLATETKIDK